ncbi:MAG: hypothetical protein ACHRXM_27415 [Isosphaerales bacterium]
METKIPTHDQIRETFASVRGLVQRSDLCLDATIDDYPIGRRDRGQCRLQVEHASGKGYRTVRTTTNRAGRWCAPKKSTYRNSVTVVVRDYDEEHQVCWLSVGNPAAQWGGTHVAIQYANGEGLSLAKCWRNDAPRRQPHTYTTTWTKSKLSITGAGVETGEPTQEKETHTLEADSPEEIAAWDVWVEELSTVREMWLDVWKGAVVTTEQALAQGYF